MDLITEQQSRELFDTLIPQERAFLCQFLINCINQYKMSNLHVDFPYYFWSVYKVKIFNNEFPAQYIEPELTPQECTFLTIYYITKAIIAGRGQR